ncbi:N-acetylmuramoyl-L-alanine amidase [Hymenobacter sp. PAMC 26628]|uniref:N-acetylmuramoyl-L-alanine amidase n=1 Tax=Hymenobacter sp. PAMC 26628 TaxID=1484118 RepID=UPI0007706345|nr:N-acetylmuramoyl-L-alanine amidase [Hymenobacter sp. PAMC 26628]AMJ64611.1 N-acetylmuramoyl-L-alanine amidase [Hymenobacter sp. PAMC 26628]
MKYVFSALALAALLASCATNPYRLTNKSYQQQAKAYARTLRAQPQAIVGPDSLPQAPYWVGTTNFGLRKPNLVIIHHTAQHSADETLKTFTLPRTQVSAHYVIGRDGRTFHLLNDYLRAWHGGAARWGNDNDINSSSIGIELDNDGTEPFAEPQIKSLLVVLKYLKKTYNIPTANFIGHADIAPTRKNDPNVTFPWKRLADKGFGLWYDEAALLDTIVVAPSAVVFPPTPAPMPTPKVAPMLTPKAAPLAKPMPTPGLMPADSTARAPLSPVDAFDPREALRIIGYDTRDLGAAIMAFKRHFIPQNVNAVLTHDDRRVLFNLYKKYL